MSGVLKVLSSIVDLLGSVIQFAIKLVSDLITVSKLLVECLARLPAYLSIVLPSALVSIFVVGITIAVIYKIAGREG